jgi:hypothetical protein
MPFMPYADLPDTSRVWIYQSNQLLNAAQSAQIESAAAQFVAQWTSHNRNLMAWGGLLHQTFLVFVVDESHADASGCSIDKSVAFVRQIEAQYNLDFFDRWCFAYKNAQNELQLAQRDDFAAAYQSQKINDNTLVFNNLVQTKADFEQKWCVALADSWHRNFVG